MFSFGSIGQPRPTRPTLDPARKVPPATPVRFPQCAPQTSNLCASRGDGEESLVSLLQNIQRPADIQMSHFEAVGAHVISNASRQEILPDVNYSPPFEEWRSVSQDDILGATAASKQPLNNGLFSPGVSTYQERSKELSIDNTAAFRTINRIPPPAGETSVRLGNAYEFFKNLDIFSTYWDDTSLPPTVEKVNGDVGAKEAPEIPPHLQTHRRIETGAQLPHEYRQNLLISFIKLVAYDFGCNVNFARCEPRLILKPHNASKPTSYFNSSASFIYRIPTDRSAARSGIYEGPLASVSCRTTTVFANPVEERLDFAREITAILLTAQQRARETQTEQRFGEGKWWASAPRWGGGTGGPIGREGDKVEAISTPNLPEKLPTTTNCSLPETPDNLSINAPLLSPETQGNLARISQGLKPLPKRVRKSAPKDAYAQMCENYRRMLPPSSTWDRKTRYISIGKAKEAGYDDIFLVSALNHHVSILRARVPDGLLDVLGGGEGEWEKLMVWRSKWFDLFMVPERIEAMELVWGMMAWLMRKVDSDEDEEVQKMDVSG